MNRKNELCYEIVKGNIKSENVIIFLDKFSQNLYQRTVVIIDKASIQKERSHTEEIRRMEVKKIRNILVADLFT